MLKLAPAPACLVPYRGQQISEEKIPTVVAVSMALDLFLIRTRCLMDSIVLEVPGIWIVMCTPERVQ